MSKRKSTPSSESKQLSLFETFDNPFDRIRHIDERDHEFWLARELMVVMEYSEWRFFLPVIKRAKVACKKGGNIPADHFEGTHDMVPLGSGAERRIDNFKLSRFGCYLTAQNGDPVKPFVALAQTYFVTEARKQELSQDKLSGAQRARQRDLGYLRSSGNDEHALTTHLETRIKSIDTVESLKKTVVTICAKPNFGQMFNAEYKALFGLFASELKAILHTKHLRDSLPELQLSYLHIAEQGVNGALKRFDVLTMDKIVEIIDLVVIPLGNHLRDVSILHGLDPITGRPSLSAGEQLYGSR